MACLLNPFLQGLAPVKNLIQLQSIEIPDVQDQSVCACYFTEVLGEFRGHHISALYMLVKPPVPGIHARERRRESED